MKSYPTINGKIVDQPIYAFDKLDGSNVRAEWSRKRGFYKFGKRNHLLDDADPTVREAEHLITETYSDDVAKICRDERWDNIVCFFEFYGQSSFAGQHVDEPHEATLIDVSTKKGILEPRDFLKIFGHVKHAPLLYHGNPNSEFLDDVRNGTLSGMTFEGVVCKGKWCSPGLPMMFKVKNHAWVERVKQRYAGNQALIEQLL